jgi:hypothetical protein
MGRSLELSIWKSIAICLSVIVVGAVMLWIMRHPKSSSSDDEAKVLVQENLKSQKPVAVLTEKDPLVQKDDVELPRELKDSQMRDANDDSLKKPKDVKPVSLTQSERTMLRKWFGHDDSVEKAKLVGATCLKHRLSDNEIVGLIGAPSHRFGSNTIAYGFAPSQLLELQFDKDGIVIKAKLTGVEIGLDEGN